MPLTDAFRARFTSVIEPAIQTLVYGGKQMRAKRVDLEKTGDSILTDIMDGVAHSALVLADVSTVGQDSKTGKPYRNANVMYEVGVALACRQPGEVLLVRDDHDPFLFDVSTVPHKQMDFTDLDQAKKILADEMMARLNEVKHIRDARLAVAAASLTSEERAILAAFAAYGPNRIFWFTKSSLFRTAAMARLLDKQLVQTAGVTAEGKAMFRWTMIGRALANELGSLLPVLHVETPPATESSPAPSTPDAPESSG